MQTPELSDQQLQAYKEIAERIAAEQADKKRVELIKREVVRKYKLSRFPRNSDIFSLAPDELKESIRYALQIRNVRSISGVNVISVMTAPFACRHGACIYCPGGPNWGTPMSYTGREPASMRAIQNGFDPVLQIHSRIDQLESTGHYSEKLEIIVMGGTFNSTPAKYQQEFMLGVYEALNGVRSSTIADSKHLNETAKYRCVGLTFETKPDWALKKHVLKMLEFGVTRVELGVQTLRDEVLTHVNRGHTLAETKAAFKALRDAGLKITAHMMPGLPLTTPEMDIEDFQVLYNDPQYIPDEVKIYPTQVIENTPLAQLVVNGEYQALSNEDTFHVIVEAKKLTPPFVRIKRALRDLPVPLVVSGPTWGDIRHRINNEIEAPICQCIRCREIGQQVRNGYKPVLQSFDIKVRSYEASEGMEHFISFEDENNVLLGFLRLRFPSADIFIDSLENSAIVRELHVYGTSLDIGGHQELSFQHRGYGTKLLQYAENMSREAGYKFLSVISGVGVREYYAKFGYTLTDFYMRKKL